MNNKEKVQEPIISIIMPVYNSEDHLNETIDSILKQSFSAFELIIIDDGSKDKSGEICDLFASLDNRVRVCHIENNGVSNARNYGIKKAKGKFIEFIDSDDMLLPNALSVAYSAIGNNDWLIYGYKTYPYGDIVSYGKEAIYNIEKQFDDGYSDLAYKHMFNSPWNKLYRRHIINDNDILFPVHVSMGEDLLFNLAYYKQCISVKVIPSELYLYRTDEGESLSNKFRRDTFEIQQLLKEEIDKTFDFSTEIVSKTSLDFVNLILNSIKTCVYSEQLNRIEKQSLINQWIKENYFINLFNKFNHRELNCDAIIYYCIKVKNGISIYWLYSIRHLLSKCLRIIKRF